MRSFENLPTEIIVMIFDHVDDFYGLESLLQSSRRAAVVFQADSVRITERDYYANRIHRGTSSTFTCDIYRFFRELVYLRTPSFRSKFPEMSLSTALSLSSIRCLSSHFRDRSHFEASNVMREMIKVAARIQRLACACLCLMSGNLKDATRNASNFHVRRVQAAFGPPSWIEELRVYRALWVLQIYSDLHAAVRSTGWDLEYAWVLEGYEAKRGISEDIVEEIRSVYGVLKDVVPSPHPMIPPGFPTPRFSGHDYLPFLLRFELKENLNFSVWAPPPIPPVDGEASHSWCLSPLYRHLSTERIEDFEKLPRSGVDSGMRTSKEDLNSFQALGVYIWHPWRYYCAGLMEPPIEKRLTPDGDYSIYSNEAVDQEMKKNILFSLIDTKEKAAFSSSRGGSDDFPSVFAAPRSEEHLRPPGFIEYPNGIYR